MARGDEVVARAPAAGGIADEDTVVDQARYVPQDAVSWEHLASLAHFEVVRSWRLSPLF